MQVTTHFEETSFEDCLRDYDGSVPTLQFVPYKQKGTTSFTVGVRTPSEYHGTILDADLFGLRTRKSAYYGSPPSGSKFLKSCLNAREAKGELFSGPLFWCLRVRNAGAKAARAHANVEYDPFSPEPHRLQGRITPTPAQYHAMAAWACRYPIRHPAIHFLRSQICSEDLRGRYNRSQSLGARTSDHFQEPAAAHWLHWFRIARKNTLEITDAPVGGWPRTKHQWQEFLSRRDHEEIPNQVCSTLRYQVDWFIRERDTYDEQLSKSQAAHKTRWST